jgi:hypothetical protein
MLEAPLRVGKLSLGEARSARIGFETLKKT